MNHDKIQGNAYIFLHNNIPTIRDLISANYNNPRNKVQGAKLKRVGLRKGRPDIEFLWNKTAYFIEVKFGKDILRPEQRCVIAKYTDFGYNVYICRSSETIILTVFNIIKSNPDWRKHFSCREVEIIENNRVMGYTIFSKPAAFFTNENIQNIFIDAMNAAKVGIQTIELIQSRIYNYGIDSKGLKLRTDSAIEFNSKSAYSPNNSKKSKQGHVDLFDSGDFFRSFEMIANADFFEISADFTKGEKNIYDNFNFSYKSQADFENAIANMNSTELLQMIDNILIPVFVDYMFKNIEEYI